jgi:hypothetical protein
MAGTKKLIGASVGDKGRNRPEDVATVQQLLVASGTRETHVMGGGWGNHSTKALAAFLEQQKLPAKDKIEPDDECLLRMAQAADIVIPMPNKRGGVGLKALHDWCVSEGITYEPGADKGNGTRAFYGLEFQGREDYAIQRNNRRYEDGPVMLNCTTYANIMVSVFKTGNVHDDPYDADCSCYGGNSNTHIGRDRYGLPLIYRDNGDKKKLNFFSTQEQIEDATEAKNIYVIEVATAEKGVSHMAVLYSGTVYECTTGQPACACLARPLEVFLANKLNKIFYLFGPFPG